MLKDLMASLTTLMGADRITEDAAEMERLSRDATENVPHLPRWKVKVATTEEVQRVMSWATQHQVPVTPRVAGMNVGGLAIPAEGGLVLDMAAMNQILKVDVAQRYALIEPGVTWQQLTDHLKVENLPLRLGYPLAPPDTSIAACCLMDGLSTLSLKYGSMGLWINGLEVVLPTGEKVITGAAAVSDVWFARGPLPDLTGLFVNWQGTTGVVTRLAFQLKPMPRYHRRHVILCGHRDAGFEGMRRLSVSGLYDEVGGLSWPVAKMAFGVSHPAPRAEGEPDFFLVVDVSAMSQREFALKNALLGEEIQGLRRAGFVVEDPVDAEDLVALNPAFVRFARLPTRLDFLLDHPGQGLTWVGTFGPVDRLEEGGARGVEILERHGFPAIIVSRPMASGHYAVLRFIEVFNRFDPDDVARVTRCQDEVGLALLDLGFVPYKCSPLLWRHVSQRMDPGARALITRVQDLLDPAGIMNPGKLGRG